MTLQKSLLLVKWSRWLNDCMWSHDSGIRIFLFILHVFRLNGSTLVLFFCPWSMKLHFFIFNENALIMDCELLQTKKCSIIDINYIHTFSTKYSVLLKNISNYISCYIQFRCTCSLIYVADNGVEGGILPL